MARRFVAVLGALAMTLLGFIGTAGSAHAYVSNNGRCESGEVCMWQNADFLGGRYDTGNSTTNFNTVVYYSGTCTSNCTLNDTVSSLKNYDAGHAVKFFEHANYGGSYFVRKAANSSNDLDQAQNLTLDRFMNSNLVVNDQISSFCFVWDRHPSTRCRQ